MSLADLTTEKADALVRADEERAAGAAPERKAKAGGILTTCLSIDWWTPEWLLDAVREYQPIALDPATAPSNPTRAMAWIAPPNDGLTADWVTIARAVDWADIDPLIWLNPPYGKALRSWLAKILEQVDRGAHIASVLPCARFEQQYLQDVLKATSSVCWVRKRVSFIRAETGDAVGGNAYASMLLLFGGRPADFQAVMHKRAVGLAQRFAA